MSTTTEVPESLRDASAELRRTQTALLAKAKELPPGNHLEAANFQVCIDMVKLLAPTITPEAAEEIMRSSTAKLQAALDTPTANQQVG